MLCGKDRCPVLMRFYANTRSASSIDTLEMAGNSPPSVFVGRFGYPKVMIGPMVPPLKENTARMDTPEWWGNITIDELVDFRSKLVRGMHPVEVHDVENPHRTVETTRELAMAKLPTGVEASFQRKPFGRLSLDSEVQPFGPSAPIRKVDADNPKWDHKMEKAYYDTDLLSKEAVLGLYGEGVLISRIQKAFSTGSFGVGKKRRFVPTRWSITAVDSMIGADMMDRTRDMPWLDHFRIYEINKLDNRWIVLMMPTEWCYELVEAWYPKTAWNPHHSGISIFNSYELNKGRKTYAEIGGCYYAARMAVNEELHRLKRQAGVVILREAHPGYTLPVGVWNVRENVRAALRTPPFRYDSWQEVFGHIAKTMEIPLERWILNSGILKDRLYQRRLDDYVKGGIYGR